MIHVLQTHESEILCNAFRTQKHYRQEQSKQILIQSYRRHSGVKFCSRNPYIKTLTFTIRLMKSPFHFILGLPGHIRHADKLFDHFHRKLHHAFMVFGLAIIGMLRGASHIMTPASATRQRWGFMTSDFRDQSPSNANIMYALFGDGTPGSTAYTRLRNSSCIPTTITNLYATGFFWWTGTSNTIYILNPGTYTLTNPIVMNGDCSVLIGKGDVTIKPANSSIIIPINVSYKNQIIIDNIKIDGQNLSSRWIYITSGNNITLNNIDSYNNTFVWAYIRDHSKNISLHNSRLFNNNYGCMIVNANTVMNNSHFFNNVRAGAYIVGGGEASINDSQFYNNDQWIYADTAYLSINNSISLNNTNEWLYFYWITWTLNNTLSYNNGVWLYIDTSYADYYGTLKLLGNATDYMEYASTLNTFASPPISSWSAGQLNTWSMTMSYDRVTNPQNGSGQWLLSGTNRTGSLRGNSHYSI